MDFKLTSSQMNFYSNNYVLDSCMWYQGIAEVFPKVYSYEQINAVCNKFIGIHECLRGHLNELENDVVISIKENEYKNYEFWNLADDNELQTEIINFLNRERNPYEQLSDCAIFQTPTSSGVMIVAHHLIVDGLSTFIMSEQINEMLKNTDYVPVFQSYAEHFEKEENHKFTKRFEKDKEYWLKQFSANPNCSIFSPRENAYDYASDEVNMAVSAELFNKIKEFCKENEISYGSFFNTVTASYINQRFDINNFTIGVPVLNRATQAELNSIGLYMHIVPLVVNVHNESFIENAKRIEDDKMTLFRHQKFTQHNIKQLLNDNGLSVNQLFDIVADVQEFPSNDEYEMRIPYNNYLSEPIEMHLQSFSEEKHNLKIRYRKAFFEEYEVLEMLETIINMMDYAAEHGSENIFAIPMCSAEMYQKVVYEFNDTPYEYDIPKNSTIYSLFEVQAKENADKVCVVADGKEITFGELLALSAKLDTQIRKYTKNKKSIIGVIADRSIEMYVAIYSIIRGGNAYLPISTEYPQDRIDYILSDSNAPLVLAQGKYTALAGKTPVIDMTESITDMCADETVPTDVNENDTAYVIYTSGSTGKPKGAKVSHKSAVNRILWMEDAYPLEENGVILQKTPYTFDVSVWEMFWWGIKGKKLVASKPNEHFLPAKIIEECSNHNVTHLHFVPSVFDLFITYLEKNENEIEKLDTVKYIFLSGEALSSKLVQRFYNLVDYKKTKLHNLYGPTECAVDVTYYDCTPADDSVIPIGKPIYNTQIHIVDKYLKPMPIGVKGELLICGVNVGQGYLNNEALTKEKFIDNPFGEGRAYRTGDLAYWREDGEVIFCGRMDGQIKLHGQRIEIGEIESAINAIEGIEGSAVIVKRQDNQEMLVAFYSGTEMQAKELKSICEKSLPKYMVPSAFVYLQTLPLNPSGKLDRKVLMGMDVDVIEDVVEAPQTESEKLICEYFKKTLNVENIGRNSDFFDFGGTSLLMISLLSEDCFKNVSPADFIANSTPKLLAMLLDGQTEKQHSFVKALKSVEGSKKAFVCFPYGGGDAEAFAIFAKDFVARTQDYTILFVPFLRLHSECERAAEEILELSKKYEIYFYSHCAGAAVAMDILNILEAKGYDIVKHYVSAGIIPPETPQKDNFWNTVSDDFLFNGLKSAGASFDGMTEEQADNMLSDFRKDTDFLTEYYYTCDKKIKAPVSLVMSKTDIFTENYKDAERLWSRYCENLCGVNFIETNSHYFQKDNSKDLIDIILRTI